MNINFFNSFELHLCSLYVHAANYTSIERDRKFLSISIIDTYIVYNFRIKMLDLTMVLHIFKCYVRPALLDKIFVKFLLLLGSLFHCQKCIFFFQSKRNEHINHSIVHHCLLLFSTFSCNSDDFRTAFRLPPKEGIIRYHYKSRSIEPSRKQ